MTSTPAIEVVALDADDTLWHSEVYFERTQRRFKELVGRYVDADFDVDAALVEVEHRNLGAYGYGIKGFTLSMIEAAIEATDGAIGVDEIGQILASGRTMLDHPVDLLPGVDQAVTDLTDAGYRLLIVTKGDLHHQEHKILASGIADRFERLEIVAEKDPATYRRVIASMGVEPGAFCMVGNSVRSDVLPVLELGAHAVHIPYHVTWAHEHVEHDGTVPTLTSIAELPAWLAEAAAAR
ncbi:HAD family hydrolase [Aquihabitans sp. G128]|uniref:HAD family hydrolase n=1 Tax=Aquihabitans sp. G128 TaxID=2849779 RepID=UPI001C243AFC|nr:HAD family hydrolase [Aquihabitans sp. G128]QXC63273.1 HAD family hydrolase [Aquihabitans sp. G128]